VGRMLNSLIIKFGKWFCCSYTRHLQFAYLPLR
jgi:hypothetical protein